eukprot:3325806-Pleurochrysis_carterae.AAC.4
MRRDHYEAHSVPYAEERISELCGGSLVPAVLRTISAFRQSTLELKAEMERMHGLSSRLREAQKQMWMFEGEMAVLEAPVTLDNLLRKRLDCSGSLKLASMRSFNFEARLAEVSNEAVEAEVNLYKHLGIADAIAKVAEEHGLGGRLLVAGQEARVRAWCTQASAHLTELQRELRYLRGQSEDATRSKYLARGSLRLISRELQRLEQTQAMDGESRRRRRTASRVLEMDALAAAGKGPGT